jgi:hypothetical protein
LKDFEQIGHENGFKPVCVRMCTVKRDLFEYVLEQQGKEHLKGRKF